MSKHKENEKCENCNNTSSNHSVMCGPCEDARAEFETTLSQIYELNLLGLSASDESDLKKVLHRLLHLATGRKQNG